VIMEAPSKTQDLLAVKDLAVSLGSRKRRVKILHGVSFCLAPGECLSLVGESGCGKTMTALSILRLLPAPWGRIDTGELLYLGEDLVKASESRLRTVRGNKITLISQDAQTALNPYLRISEQLVEGLMHHKGMREKEALEQGISMLESVGIPGARGRVHDYPHQFSGGMLQRIMIAMALMTSPDLVIADEPTSALDVTIQAQTLKLLDDLRASTGAAVLLITHDLGIVAGRSDRIAVMYAGRIVEHGNTARVLKSPGHPYMKALLASNPSVHQQNYKRLTQFPGPPPRRGAAPPGCAFAPRCPHVMDRCKKEIPSLMELGEGHEAACWLV